MATVHISESEAAADFAGIMARVRQGTEIIIESDSKPIAIIRPTETFDPSTTATLARLKNLAEKRGHELRMDDDYAADMEEIIRNRKPRDRSTYEQFD